MVSAGAFTRPSSEPFVCFRLNRCPVPTVVSAFMSRKNFLGLAFDPRPCLFMS